MTRLVAALTLLVCVACGADERAMSGRWATSKAIRFPLRPDPLAR
jgi:hypothetical protein